MRSSMRAACFCEAKQSFLEGCVDRYGQNPSGMSKLNWRNCLIALISIHSTDMQLVRGSTKGYRYASMQWRAMACNQPALSPCSFVMLCLELSFRLFVAQAQWTERSWRWICPRSPWSAGRSDSWTRESGLFTSNASTLLPLFFPVCCSSKSRMF